jgi:hypothetical protein
LQCTAISLRADVFLLCAGSGLPLCLLRGRAACEHKSTDTWRRDADAGKADAQAAKPLTCSECVCGRDHVPSDLCLLHHSGCDDVDLRHSDYSLALVDQALQVVCRFDRAGLCSMGAPTTRTTPLHCSPGHGRNTIEWRGVLALRYGNTWPSLTMNLGVQPSSGALACRCRPMVRLCSGQAALVINNALRQLAAFVGTAAARDEHLIRDRCGNRQQSVPLSTRDVGARTRILTAADQGPFGRCYSLIAAHALAIKR